MDVLSKVIKYCRRYGFGWGSDIGERHAFKVRDLALKIFDDTRKIHDMDGYEKNLLEFASLLHDIGRYSFDENHHIESRNMILKSRELREILAPNDIKIIAWTTFFHRKKPNPLKYSDEEWNRIKSDRKIFDIIIRLASILRIADALDYSLSQIVENIDIKYMENRLVFQIHAKGDADIEVAKAYDKAELFKEIFNINIDFIQT